MPKYYVTFKIDGRFVTEVEADNLEAAKETATQKYYDADFGEINTIDAELTVVEDENGNFIYEK